ncbi:MAG TPA: hypothetical protein VI215_00910 [Bacteroidota bacterium]|jgi:glycerate-2-kinase
MRRITLSTNDPLDIPRLRGEIPPEGVTIEFPPSRAFKAWFPEDVAQFFLVIDAGVAAALIAQYIMRHLKESESTTITIESKEVSLEEGEIVRVLHEVITVEKKQ